MEEFKLLVVGEQVCSPSADAVYFSLSDAGAELTIKMRNPTSREKNAFKGRSYQFRFAVVNDIIFFLCRFGTQPWMDAPYYSKLAPYHIEKPADSSIGLGLNALLIDAATGILVSQKLIGLQHDFSVKLLEAAERQPVIPDYQTRLAMTMQLYNTQELLQRAEG